MSQKKMSAPMQLLLLVVLVGVILVASFFSFLSSRDRANTPPYEVGDCLQVSGSSSAPDVVAASCSDSTANYRVVKTLRGDGNDSCADRSSDAYVSVETRDGFYGLCLARL
jgi:hypothetical protein